MRTLRGVFDGTVDTKTLNGREHLVVPVVALVEGVLHAANAENPEFVPTYAFGRIPDAWNGRPVVVNHPVNASGTSVSASSPDVLEAAYLGLMLNAAVDGDKLRVEAWIDLENDNKSKNPIKKMLSRIANNEVIEVSVGAYVFTIPQEGEFEGKAYSQVWDVVIPDHLAFLSNQKGACSVADGCGAFRTDSQRTLTFSTNASAALEQHKEIEPVCDCQNKDAKPAVAADTTDADPTVTTEATADAEAVSRISEMFSRTCLANGLYDNDVRQLLSRAIKDAETYAYLIAFSDEHAIYECYHNDRYAYYQRDYSIGSDNKVTLADDKVEVIMQTKVVTVASVAGDPVDDTTGADIDSNEGVTTMAEKENTIVVERSASVEDTLKAFENTEFGARVASALSAEKGIRDGHIAVILAAPTNKLTAEMLGKLDTTVLASVAELAAQPKPVVEDTTTANPTNAGRGGAAATEKKGDKVPQPPSIFTQEFLTERRKSMRA